MRDKTLKNILSTYFILYITLNIFDKMLVSLPPAFAKNKCRRFPLKTFKSCPLDELFFNAIFSIILPHSTSSKNKLFSIKVHLINHSIKQI
jgi:hypothetical protein